MVSTSALRPALYKGETMETIKLKNGAEEATQLVEVTMSSLRTLFKKEPIVFYELVMKCRNRNHEFFGKTGQTLQELGMSQKDNAIHNSIKNIVLSATSGDGFNMKLDTPIAAYLKRSVMLGCDDGTGMGWRRVEDEMPAPGVDVLIYGFGHTDITANERRYYTARYSNDFWGWSIPGIGGLSATHWMPLPEPPEA